ncbi:MAG TPA: Lrp/AsnC ligand binding domain-containing protein [Thermoplasmata archaeon]|nr:Lrp/AsnC ligand binding domain-containing protein [Thermoplasmata archaeon]
MSPGYPKCDSARVGSPGRGRVRYAYLGPGFTTRSGAATAIGFVLIDIEPTREKEIYQRLLKLDGIVELYPLFGEYDLIAKVEEESFDAIGTVVSKIRQLEGVKATKTLTRMSL